MNLRLLRQVFKGCADDTRLRILNILAKRELTVKEICAALKISQPTISKHLARLRLLKMVIDRRKANLVYYRLNMSPGTTQAKVVGFMVSRFKGLKTFQRDKKMVEKIKK